MDEKTKGADEIFCSSCGVIIKKDATLCVKCGVPVKQNKITSGNISDKSRLAALLLCNFLGIIGVHRFYVGKVGSGIFQILTVGGLGIWTLIDWIAIVTGNFTDVTHNKLSEWNPQ